MVPAATTVAGPVLAIARSADALTPVVTDEVLFVGSGSLVVLDTLAVLVRLAAWFGAVTTTVMAGAVTPVATAGRVQATETLPVLVQVQPVPVADTNTTPAGSVSDTVTLAASDGPSFTTDTEYDSAPAAVTVGGPVLVIARSAEAVTLVLAAAVLLPRFGSAVVDDTDAEFVRVVVWAGAVTTTAMVGAVAPATRVAAVQVADAFPALLQLQPVPEADTNVTPAGSVSVTDRFAALDGPLFDTTSW